MSIEDTKFESAVSGYQPLKMLRAVKRAWEIAEWRQARWVNCIEEKLQGNGFVGVQSETVEVPRYLGRAFAVGEVLGFGAIAINAGSQDKEFAEIAREAAEEVIEMQVGCFPKIMVATARKAG